MRIYTEDSLDGDKKRPIVNREEPVLNAEYIDIFDRFDWLREYVDNPNNSVKRFYKNLNNADHAGVVTCRGKEVLGV